MGVEVVNKRMDYKWSCSAICTATPSKNYWRLPQFVTECVLICTYCICSAIETELQLKHTREMRWMFNRALQYMPVNAKLWTDVSPFCTYLIQ